MTDGFGVVNVPTPPTKQSIGPSCPVAPWQTAQRATVSLTASYHGGNSPVSTTSDLEPVSN